MTARAAPGSGDAPAGVRLVTEEVRPEAGAPSRWMHLLHGFLGAGRNWRSTARRVADARPDWAGLLVDLRLHGGSRDAPPPHTLEACVRDLGATVEAGAPRPRALLGHSFGGKVVLAAAADRPAGLEQVWVLDATPSAGEPTGSPVEMLEVVRRRQGPFADREEAVSALGDEGFPPRVGRWMATNLEETGDGLRWALDPDALEELLEDLFRRDLWTVVEEPPEGLELHVVKAEGSDVLGEDEVRRIEAAAPGTGRVHLHRLEGGHWLNISNPEGVLELLERRLPR